MQPQQSNQRLLAGLFDDEKAKVFFEQPDGSIKSVLASRIPEHETAYAMTIHKSQGSEFSHTAIILDAYAEKLLSQELIYTAITRAKKVVSILATQKSLRAALTIRTVRRSGLVQKINLD